MRQSNEHIYKTAAASVFAMTLSAALPLTAHAQQQQDQQGQQNQQPQSQQSQNQQPQNQRQADQQQADQQQAQADQQESGSQSPQEGQEQAQDQDQDQDQDVARLDGERQPYAQPNESWISISGTVDTVTANAFTLDYGDGVITVEMDDQDRDADAYVLDEGDKVRVSGLVDDDVFEIATIEASSVYVEKLGTTFFSSVADEEDLGGILTVSIPVVISDTALQGIVTEVDGDEFTLDTGATAVSVEVEEMPYDPLDNEGYQKIEVGDHVSATGYIDRDFFEGREFEARSITTLVEEIG